MIDHFYRSGVRAPSHMLLALCATGAIVPAWIFCHSEQLWLSRLAYLVFNFLVFAATPAGLTGWQLLTSERRAGMTIAILVSIVTLVGAGIGPALVGWITDHVFGREAALGSSLFTVICVAAGGCGVLAICGQTSYRKVLDQRLSERAFDAAASGLAAVSSRGQFDGSSAIRPL